MIDFEECVDCRTMAEPLREDDYGDLRCARCQRHDDESREEAAYERLCESYYGGDGPVTLGEQCRAAWALKRALKGW